MNTVKAQMLTEEAFAPFGKVITTQNRAYGGEAGMYNWYEGQSYVDGADRVSINLLTAIQRDYVFDKFEAHARTTETVLPLTGGLIVTCVPQGEVTPERVQAFYVPVGKGISWAPGAWHYAPFPIGGDATCAVIFRDGTGGDDAIFETLREPMGLCL